MSSPPGIWATESGALDGPLMVMIHGSMDRSAGMLRLARVVDRQARVLRYDRRGYGRSVPHDGPFGIDQQVDDLVALLADRPAVLFGHSYGGNVALALADRAPELVRAVAVYEAPLAWRDWWPGTTAGGTAVAAAEEPPEAAERFMRRLIGDERWERLPPSARASRRREGVAMVGELTDLRSTRPWRADRVRCPAIALYGERGAAHHRQAMAEIASEVDRCRLERIDGARHFGPNTHARAVASVLIDLIDLLDGAETSPGSGDRDR